jgi:hypothetical protein
LGPGWLSPTDWNLGTWVGHGLEQGLELGSRLVISNRLELWVLLGFPISLVFGLVLEQGLDLGVQAGYL